MLGAPEPALARMTRPVESGSDTVMDADPADVSASACPPEALLSETIRPAPDDERLIVASSIGVGVAVALALALLVVLLALLVAGRGTAVNLSRRAEISPTAARVSVGIVGVLSEPAPDGDASALAADAAVTGAEVMADVGV